MSLRRNLLGILLSIRTVYPHALAKCWVTTVGNNGYCHSHFISAPPVAFKYRYASDCDPRCVASTNQHGLGTVSSRSFVASFLRGAFEFFYEVFASHSYLSFLIFHFLIKNQIKRLGWLFYHSISICQIRLRWSPSRMRRSIHLFLTMVTFLSSRTTTACLRHIKGRHGPSDANGNTVTITPTNQEKPPNSGAHCVPSMCTGYYYFIDVL